MICPASMHEDAYNIIEENKMNKENLKHGVLMPDNSHLGYLKVIELEQQLAQQKAMLDEAIECIEFYAIDTNWEADINGCYGRIDDSDIENTLNSGGKRARAFLEKVKNGN